MGGRFAVRSSTGNGSAIAIVLPLPQEPVTAAEQPEPQTA